MPKVSAIIPVYNTEKYLRKCLESVCNQKKQFDEIILVDDGSSDRSLEICMKYQTKHNHVKAFNRLCSLLNGYVKTIIISFIDKLA